jgi:dihydropteroate synthase
MREWHCGQYRLEIGRKTLVMGIVNATPDSFSGDGHLGDDAIKRALQMVEDGADILDIGGESTRPGATPVSSDEECRRVLPLIEALAERANVPLSVDTSKSEVARHALEAGASIINDISGGTFDAAMMPMLAQHDCGIVMMHLRGTKERAAGGQSDGDDVIAEVLAFWSERVQAARREGIADERLVLDAGFGFGKTVEENLTLLRRGQELNAFGFPTLSATSRKSTIGKVLGDAPVEERLFGTAACVSLAIAQGADIVRVHDVRAMGQVARMTDAVVRS